jgi:MFS transporter, ACS family, hexuronate transporter
MSRWAAVTIFAVSVMINALDRNLLANVQPSLRSDFHLDNAQYGELVAAFSIVYGLSAPLMGWALDRFGLTPVSTVAVGLWSFASLMTGSAGSFMALLGWRALLGFAESAALPASGKAYALLLKPRERSLGTAANQLGLAAGSVGAAILAGWVTHWQSAFYCAAPLGFLWIPIWIWTSRRAPLDHSARPPVSDLAGSAGTVLRDPKLWALAGANLLTMPLYSLWTNWTTAYLVRERGLTQSQANLEFAWIPPVLATLGGAFGGWLVLRQSVPNGVQTARFRLCLGAACALLLTAGIPFLPSTLLVTLAIGMSFFFTLAISVNVYAMPLDLYGPARSGFAFSMLTSVYGLMQAAVSPLIGRIVDQSGFRPICLIGAVCPLAGILILWMAGLNRDRTA